MPTGTKSWLEEVAFSFDCTFNALVGGWASEPFSTRCHRREKEEPILKYCRRVIDFVALHIFGQVNHCQQSYKWLPKRLHFPPDMR